MKPGEIWLLPAGVALIAGLIVATWLRANRPRLSDRQVLLLAATLAVVATAMIVAVALPRQPAAVIAVLSLGWIAFRAVGPTLRTTGHSPSVGQLLLAIAASIAAAGAILFAVRANL